MFKTITLNNEFATVPDNKIWYVNESTLSLTRDVFIGGESIAGTGIIVVSEFDSQDVIVEPVITPTPPTPTPVTQFINGWQKYATPLNSTFPTTANSMLQYIVKVGSTNISSFDIKDVSNGTISNTNVDASENLMFTLTRDDIAQPFSYGSVELALSNGEIITLDGPEFITYDVQPTSSTSYNLGDNIPDEIIVPVTIPSLSHSIDLNETYDFDVYGTSIKSTASSGFNTGMSIGGGSAFTGLANISFSGSMETDGTSALTTNENFFEISTRMTSTSFSVESEGLTTVAMSNMSVRYYNHRGGTSTLESYSKPVEIKVDVTVSG